MTYPDYIKAFRPKGSIVRLRNGRYTVFRATSKHVPGKKYPVLKVGELLGWIDSSGFHEQTKVMVDFATCSTYEYGFTNLLLLKEPEFIETKKNEGLTKDEAGKIYRSLIVSVSRISYLNVTEKSLLTTDEIAERYHINVCRAKARMISMIGLREEEMRLFFSAVGIYDGKTFRTLPMPEELLSVLDCYGIDRGRVCHGQ